MKRHGTHVFIWQGGRYRHAGTLVLDEEKNRLLRSRFQYASSYIEQHDAALAPLDPASLPLAAGSRIVENDAERPLFGIFADCCPDHWGRRILQAIAAEKKLDVSFLDWITAAGKKRIGALAFGSGKDAPSWDSPLQIGMAEATEGNLPDLMRAAEMFQNQGLHDMPEYLKHILATGSSIGGARPKTLLDYQGRPAIAKFKARGDTWNVCRIEYATMTFAATMGLDVPAIWIESIGGPDVFLIERFDRTPQGPVHMVTASTMIRERTDGPQLKDQRSYMEIADAIGRHGVRGHVLADQRELYQRMVYNILMNNEDDHLRNHAFFFDGGGWRLTKLYDVVPMELPVRHLWLEAGRDATAMTLSNALTSHAAFGLNLAQAREIVEEMTDVFFTRWEAHFKDHGVPDGDMGRLRQLLGPRVREDMEHDAWVRAKFLGRGAPPA